MSGLATAPVVAHVLRNGFVESVHHGVGVETDAGGAVAFAVGDPGTPMFPRSSLKPVQAVAMLRAGAPLAGEHLALACASHVGEPFHVAGVRAMLAASGLGEAALRNTPGLPHDERSRTDWLRAGHDPESIAQGCSGKHAGMLAACVAAGWPTDDYLDPGHPLQRLIRDTVADLTGTPPLALAVDGCGAPIHAVPLAGLARAFGRLAAASGGPERQVADAMRAHPAFVSGTSRSATRLMRDLPGAIAKDGAEAVYAAGLADGRGFAVKITDGGDRAAGVLLAALLRRAGAASDAALEALADAPVLGHGHPVGAVVAVGPATPGRPAMVGGRTPARRGASTVDG